MLLNTDSIVPRSGDAAHRRSRSSASINFAPNSDTCPCSSPIARRPGPFEAARHAGGRSSGNRRCRFRRNGGRLLRRRRRAADSPSTTPRAAARPPCGSDGQALRRAQTRADVGDRQKAQLDYQGKVPGAFHIGRVFKFSPRFQPRLNAATCLLRLNECALRRVGRVQRIPPRFDDAPNRWDSLHSAHPTGYYVFTHRL